MHESVMKWTAQVIKNHVGPLEGLNVLEVGSYNVNGSVKQLFAGVAQYVGTDMREGPDVDFVCDAHLLPDAWESSFDVVISTEMLEHDKYFWLSLEEMGDALKPQGHLIITARGNGFPPHDYPGDYWRFMPSSFGILFDIAGCELIECKDDPQAPGVFGYGRKR